MPAPGFRRDRLRRPGMTEAPLPGLFAQLPKPIPTRKSLRGVGIVFGIDPRLSRIDRRPPWVDTEFEHEPDHRCSGRYGVRA